MSNVFCKSRLYSADKRPQYERNRSISPIQIRCCSATSQSAQPAYPFSSVRRRLLSTRRKTIRALPFSSLLKCQCMAFSRLGESANCVTIALVATEYPERVADLSSTKTVVGLVSECLHTLAMAIAAVHLRGIAVLQERFGCIFRFDVVAGFGILVAWSDSRSGYFESAAGQPILNVVA